MAGVLAPATLKVKTMLDLTMLRKQLPEVVARLATRIFVFPEKEFNELEAANVPNVVDDVDIAIINGNYAIAAGFKVNTDALAVESADSEAAKTYANLLVVKDGNQDSDKIKALAEALNSDEVRDYINNTYEGAVVPVF